MYKYSVGDAVIVDNKFYCEVVNRFKYDGKPWYEVRLIDCVFDARTRELEEERIKYVEGESDE